MKTQTFLLFLLAWQQISPAQAIDLLPGEGQAPRPGSNYLQLIYQQSERGDFYRQGQKLRSDTRIASSQFQVRLGRSFALAGQPALAYLQIPVDNRIEPKAALANTEAVSGTGDITLILAYWPYANRQTQTYFGAAGYLTLPTGDYERHRSFNPGGNRWSGDIQLGYQQQLLDPLLVMLVADVLWSGKNNDYGSSAATLQQGALYSTQASLRYDINPRYSIGVSHFLHAGGETRINGMERNDRLQTHRYQLMSNINCAWGRLTLQYGGDIKTRNGYFEDRRWILRYTRVF
jgi:hypothetical protein